MDVRNNPPAGLLFHTAGFVDDRTWRIFDVWESREDVERFMNERLMPALKELPADAGAGPRPVGLSPLDVRAGAAIRPPVRTCR